MGNAEEADSTEITKMQNDPISLQNERVEGTEFRVVIFILVEAHPLNQLSYSMEMVNISHRVHLPWSK